jgi:hypothetical protein
LLHLDFDASSYLINALVTKYLLSLF